MSNCDCSIEIKSKEQSRVLITLLVINAVMFAVEMVAGIVAESTALLADSLDMLADAAVYGIGLYAVGRVAIVKVRAAYTSGFFQMGLALIVALDIGRRAVLGSDPGPAFMVVVGFIALVANVVCLVLLAKHRDGEIHMRASWIFSKNDVIANVGVILGGWLVHILGARWPDLIIGIIIASIVFRGGLNIIVDARHERMRSVTNQ